MQYDVIIVGAGAAGLLAARELSRNRKKVLVLEASDHIGGRAYILTDPNFPQPLEMGAEFIHGEQLMTLGLLNEYKIPYRRLEGEYWRCMDNKLEKDKDVIREHAVLEEKLLAVTTEMPLHQFLETELGDHEHLRKAVKNFVEGYDTADLHRASTYAFREEWVNFSEQDHFRISGGYAALMSALASSAGNFGARIIRHEAVKNVRWSPGKVEVMTDGFRLFDAHALLLTSPLGVLMSPGCSAHVHFSPALHYPEAARKLGFGDVIKVFFHFREPFWKNKREGCESTKDLGFVFSDATIPTWWTQYPDENNLLTGWVGGPDAAALSTETEDVIKDIALESLAYIFREHYHVLHTNLFAWKVKSWTNDLYTLGSYRYNTVNEEEYLRHLEQPVAKTIFLAGEGIYRGVSTGTVEAALVSGKQAADQILEAMG